ncbi:formylglycine-generating enzyme family protein [Flagellimonas flava]|uniref:Formylglycine-generating enzyme, required for sulfatase activity, contains SUMF1/FGE domain n=1 Tax=Flagellimonas flava TaxID=570519 RepID=A0A1M5M072_9FLAO|nr:formylglycine-generating enzyme family protein [Allomuricauda flava]SHG70626.1 Formylglycine-generating enzyme, required for sulfatase activity, contains SUMF1/FGE domain [Allomuricauda flava]
MNTKILILKNLFPYYYSTLALMLLFSCKQSPNSQSKGDATPNIQVSVADSIITKIPSGVETPEGMVWIPGGTFHQGAVPTDNMAMNHEKPRHEVAIDGFFMDITEVTNAQFETFVVATDYITLAEKEIDWEEMKKQLPEGTPKPHDSIMQPGSLVFKKGQVSNLQDYSQWWQWTIGANWRHPYGPKSSIIGMENEPVVHIAYEDALAYCEWAGRRLPTEAEWEYAARGGNANNIHYWGDAVDSLAQNANTWTGNFPKDNDKEDGFERRAPVKSYPPNGYGLHDMAGNVWEWTSDWYNSNYYQELSSTGTITKNPRGATRAFNSGNPYAVERVIKGGSFLCSASYCASYRVSARMATSLDSSLEHLGFRTVKDALPKTN